jgi:lysophospholipase L1-like esterase
MSRMGERQSPATAARRPREWALRLILVVLSVPLGLAAGELLLRATGFEYRPLAVDTTGRDGRSELAFESAHFSFDDELIWRPRPGRSVFNEQGFRGPPIDSDRPRDGALRIFAVGDSNTLGWAGPQGSNWPASLQPELARLWRAAVVVNAGVWGYSSYQGVRRLRECLRYRPDVVLVSFGSNDAQSVAVSDEDFVTSGGGAGSLGRLGRLGQLGLALRDRLRGPAPPRTHRVPLDAYEANLGLMSTEARQAGARIVFLTRPYVGESDDADWWKVRGSRYNAATVSVAAARDVPVIDVYSRFKTSDDLFADESHFTDAGHQLAARAIARELVGYLD